MNESTCKNLSAFWSISPSVKHSLYYKFNMACVHLQSYFTKTSPLLDSCHHMGIQFQQGQGFKTEYVTRTPLKKIQVFPGHIKEIKPCRYLKSWVLYWPNSTVMPLQKLLPVSYLPNCSMKKTVAQCVLFTFPVLYVPLYSTFNYSHQFSLMTCTQRCVTHSDTHILYSLWWMHHPWPPILVGTDSSLAPMEMATLFWLEAGG